MMKRFLLYLVCFLLLTVAVHADDAYLNDSLSYRDRASDLVVRMALMEKAGQLNNDAPAVSRLSLPAYQYNREGIHGWMYPGQYTVFPMPIAMGATWDPDLVYLVGSAISDEARGNNEPLNVWAPNINLARDPRWGRTEETYTEDPYLLSRFAVAYVSGMEGNNPRCLKTSTTVKHFAANNYEVERFTGSSEVDMRSLYEYYFPAFKAGVTEGRSRSVMSAYNAINGVPSNVNPWLLGDVLRGDWGFEGFVNSDCGDISGTVDGHHYVSTLEDASALSIRSGCDTDCGYYEFRDYLPSAVRNKLLTEADLDIAARRVLETRFLLGEFDSDTSLCSFNSIPQSEVNSQEHRDLALQVEREAIVLLKNSNNILPLSKTASSIALIGPYANDYFLGGYSGSPLYKVSPVQGIRNKLPGITINYVQGANMDGSSTDAMLAAAEAAARNSQIAVVFLGTNDSFSSEGRDAANLDLPGRQTELAQRVFQANARTVVVLNSGNPLSINWIASNIPGVLESWHGGQEYGNALADVLFGDYNPGGKLPQTYYKDSSLLPSINDYNIFNKRLYMYCDDANVLYPFGHGLSYTTFVYSNLVMSRTNIQSYDTISVSVDVKNTGSSAGDEVVQLYLKDASSTVAMPKKALKGFKRVNIQPGETKTVSFSLKGMDGAYYDITQKRFVVEPGDFNVLVGSSSADIRLTGTLYIGWSAPQYEGLYKIVNKNSGLSLETADDSESFNGQTILQGNYYGYNTQKWTIERVDDQSYKVINLHSGYVLDVRDISLADGAVIQQWSYGGGDNQRFIITDLGGGYISIKAKHSGKALDVTGGSMVPGVIVWQNPYSGAASQQWQIVKLNDNATISLPPAWTQERKVLISGGANYLSAKNNNYAVSADRAAGGADELFYLYNLSDGSIVLKAESNGKYLGVNAGSSLLYADQNSAGSEETFYLTGLGNGLVSFRSKWNNKYLSFGSSGRMLTASKDSVGPDEAFTISAFPVNACTPNQVSGCQICEADGSDWADTDSKCLFGHKCVNGRCIINSAPTVCISVSLKAYVNDRYVCAEDGGNSSLIANRDAVGPWEIFDLIPSGDGTIGLRSNANGKYVTAEDVGAASLIANRDSLGPWEKFSIQDAGSGYVALKAGINDKYVTAESAGISPLIANRDEIGSWEKFALTASSSGNCVASCVNECSPSGARQCRGNGYWACGYYDSDPCMDWSTVTNCQTGQNCLNGVCITASTTSSTTTTLRTTTTTSTTTTRSTSSTTTTTRTTTTTSTTTTHSTTSTSSTTTTLSMQCSASPDSWLTVGVNTIVFQTPHNYASSMDCDSGTYTCPTGYAANIHVRYDVESWYDYFYVSDPVSGNSTPYSGNSSGYVWVDSDYNSVRFRFTSDGSINRWGVDVDLIDCHAASTTTTTSTTVITSTTSTTVNATSTSTTTRTTQATTTTTISGPCAMKGNEPPCAEISLSEVVDAINQWITGGLGIGEVIDLINSWTDPSVYPPN
jgi:beta-glucosidase